MTAQRRDLAEFNREYANFLRRTSWYKHAHEGDAKEFAYLAFGIAGESGEFCDAFKKIVRRIGFDDLNMLEEELEAGGRETLVDELGDILWYITRLCDFLGITMQQLMLLNTDKLYHRITMRPDLMAKMGNDLEWPFSHDTRNDAWDLRATTFKAPC